MDCKHSKILDNNVNATKNLQQQNYLVMDNLQRQYINQSNKMASGYHGVNAPPVLPIDDFHLIENPNKYSEEEKQLRIKLAAVYRLIEINGWSMSIYNHVTVSKTNFYCL